MIERRNDSKPRLSKEEIEIRLAQGVMWNRFAVCGPETAHLFESDAKSGRNSSKAKKALAICAGCPVLKHCRGDAVTRGDDSWIRGGLVPSEISEAIEYHLAGEEIPWDEIVPKEKEPTRAYQPTTSEAQPRRIGGAATGSVVTQLGPPRAETVMYQSELTSELSSLRTIWNEPFILPRVRTRGPQRVFDGVFQPRNIPQFNESNINDDQRAALATIFEGIYACDRPFDTVKNCQDLASFFVRITIDGDDKFMALKKVEGSRDLARIASDFVDHKWGAQMLGERGDILRQTFEELRNGEVPRIPSREELQHSPKLDAVIRFLSLYRQAGCPPLRDEKFVISQKATVVPSFSAEYLLKLAKVDEASIKALEDVGADDLRRIGYDLTDCFKSCGYSPQDAVACTSRFLFPLMGVEDSQAGMLLQDKGELLNKPKMKNTFVIEGAAVRDIFRKRPVDLLQAS